jgi:hypothetical protein
MPDLVRDVHGLILRKDMTNGLNKLGQVSRYWRLKFWLDEILAKNSFWL